MKGRRPRPLDDGDLDKIKVIVAPHTANYRDMSYSTYLTSRISGAPEGIRTPDLLITNQLLYQLSYRGTDTIL